MIFSFSSNDGIIQKFYYDPELGRFMQADTVLDGLNRYTYCHNNPINYNDPTGYTADIPEKEYEKYIGMGGYRTGLEGTGIEDENGDILATSDEIRKWVFTSPEGCSYLAKTMNMTTTELFSGKWAGQGSVGGYNGTSPLYRIGATLESVQTWLKTIEDTVRQKMDHAGYKHYYNYMKDLRYRQDLMIFYSKMMNCSSLAEFNTKLGLYEVSEGEWDWLRQTQSNCNEPWEVAVERLYSNKIYKEHYVNIFRTPKNEKEAIIYGMIQAIEFFQKYCPDAGTVLGQGLAFEVGGWYK